MHKELVITRDGSHTLSVPGKNVTYHSVHGAIQESLHVFIEAGLRQILNGEKKTHDLRIFEMGFGTGLNALLSMIEAERYRRKIYYECVEAFPLETVFVQQLNYCERLNRKDIAPAFEKMHACNWDTAISISPYFTFKKCNRTLQDHTAEKEFHLVYYDAFAPVAQPELWTKEIFEKIYQLLSGSGIMVTYCSKGDVRRNLVAAGFKVEKLPGPPSKREMLRTLKF